jgi:DNA-directed RNA polymerase specialized sigma24 family protein
LGETEDPFDLLLTWLDPNDRESAGIKYETIRGGLIRFFIKNGCDHAEDLADVTISRVTKRLPEIIDTYEGEPAPYFVGVARNVAREGPPREVATDLEALPISWIQVTNRSELHDCLIRCLKFLTRSKRELILDYYVYKGHEKIETHKEMAEELGISKGALRLRAHHIRTDLEKCVERCMKAINTKTKTVAGDIVSGDTPDRSLSRGRSGKV